MRRAWLWILALLCLGLCVGCAHVLEFRTPQEFQGKKVKEDPPGTYAPMLLPGTRSC